MSSPAIVTRPEVGGRTPAITLNSVVLPAPLGPISPVIDPFGDPHRRAVDRVKAAEMLVNVVDDDHGTPPSMARRDIKTARTAPASGP
jgi:hypothetical protein